MECIKNTQACKFWPCQARRGDNVGLCVLVMQWYLVVKVAYFMRWYEYQAGQPKFNGSRIFMTSQILWKNLVEVILFTFKFSIQIWMILNPF